MKIILKTCDGNYSKIFHLKEFESFHQIFQDFYSIKKPVEATIFALDEIINFYQLEQLKINFEKLNLQSIHLYSNKRETILSGKSIKIDSTFVAEKELKKRLFLNSPRKQDDILHKGTIRSGDRISSNGDLFIIGDVNPGAIISAKRNVYVWGKLLGIALAGNDVNRNASIASLYLNPVQLRICNFVAIGPKDKPKNFYPEIALLEKESINIKPYIIDT